MYPIDQFQVIVKLIRFTCAGVRPNLEMNPNIEALEHENGTYIEVIP